MGSEKTGFISIKKQNQTPCALCNICGDPIELEGMEKARFEYNGTVEGFHICEGCKKAIKLVKENIGNFYHHGLF